ncbi:COX15/CtaA family protein [Coralliovum pocilloporae]|uniref:COX15/CtaA family protein n=1 Tax=Coralliovum pocilloporae TaxID=3066369 RepID=UPI003306EAAE
MTSVDFGRLARNDQAVTGRAVIVWLYVIALLIFVMVLVGGATRLTDSGLSITEWKPIHGAIPPLSVAEWQEEFDKYKQIPEYELVNKGMSLEEFKFIFWWEWGHRFLGRFIGVAFLLPFLFFLWKGAVPTRHRPQLWMLFVLGGLQGAIGWWMVASGLTERVDVSQYRLAVHLTLACVIFAYTIWVAKDMQLERKGLSERESQFGYGLAWVLLLLTLGQIFLGGLVAGLHAGHGYNTWPLMGETFVPEGLLQFEPVWINVFENAITVQFDHRILAYILFGLTLVHTIRMWDTPMRRGAMMLMTAVTAQAIIGIGTLVHSVPMALGLLHQGGAVVVLWVAVAHLRRLASMPE